jgi:hypothetical protein
LPCGAIHPYLEILSLKDIEIAITINGSRSDSGKADLGV